MHWLGQILERIWKTEKKLTGARRHGDLWKNMEHRGRIRRVSLSSAVALEEYHGALRLHLSTLRNIVYSEARLARNRKRRWSPSQGSSSRHSLILLEVASIFLKPILGGYAVSDRSRGIRLCLSTPASVSPGGPWTCTTTPAEP
jgi:hypothetical protein